MLRKIIKIDEEKCNGCGLCASACHEGAIEMAGGKAKLVREDYCDGLGDCLPVCPAQAISFEVREAPGYDEEAVLKAKAKSKPQAAGNAGDAKSTYTKAETPCACPGSRSKTISRGNAGSFAVADNESMSFSLLSQWPVQLKLVPVRAGYFDGANLLVAADCSAYAYGNFHKKFMKNRVTLIACPKLDMCDYSEKLTEIIKNNDIKSLTVVRMEVPCCGGIEFAAKKALRESGKFIPWQVVTISADGEILD
ncbi:MAG: 4Fe-4S binding protein [Eubacteriales bacterium]